MDFVAVDVETANSDISSICQIGIVVFKEGVIVDEWISLINPQSHFERMNVRIHGITDVDVKGAPTFSEVATKVTSYFKDHIVISHGPFDRNSLTKIFSKLNLDFYVESWLDTTSVVRRTWPEFAKKGYGLSNVCATLGIEFKHHDALEDAKAAGAVLIEAIKLSGISLNDWPKRVSQSISGLPNTGSSFEINPDGVMFGEVVVFTGALAMPRGEASNIAAFLGCDVGKGVNKSTTLLVVGDQDIERLAGKTKSSKQIKAESLISKGQEIRILAESDFFAMIS